MNCEAQHEAPRPVISFRLTTHNSQGLGRRSWEAASSIFLLGILLRRKSSGCNSEIIVFAVPPALCCCCVPRTTPCVEGSRIFALLTCEQPWYQEPCDPIGSVPHLPVSNPLTGRKRRELPPRSRAFITAGLTVWRYSVALFIVMHLNGHFHTQLFQARVSSARCPIAHRK